MEFKKKEHTQVVSCTQLAEAIYRGYGCYGAIHRVQTYKEGLQNYERSKRQTHAKFVHFSHISTAAHIYIVYRYFTFQCVCVRACARLLIRNGFRLAGIHVVWVILERARLQQCSCVDECRSTLANAPWRSVLSSSLAREIVFIKCVIFLFRCEWLKFSIFFLLLLLPMLGSNFS